ncbi:MAG: hypothetical protein WD576_03710 [Nitriliruptoraceae bacterium]
MFALQARIRDVRSLWGAPVTVPLEAVTVLVGPNRAGSSNVLFALAAALDPSIGFTYDRDAPRRRQDSHPEVEFVSAAGNELAVMWQPGGVRIVDAPEGTGVQTGHTVLCRVTDTAAEIVRRAPIVRSSTARTQIAQLIRELLSRYIDDIGDVTVAADGDVQVADRLGFPLAEPEIRVAVALAVATYLSEHGPRVAPALLAIESPEAYLHPAAQELVAHLIVEVAHATGTRVVIATASPFVIPRAAEVLVVGIARDVAGRTEVIGVARGDEPQAHLLGGLLRDGGLAQVLDRIGRVAEGTRAVLIVEGGTDEAYLRLAAEILGREDAFDRVVISPSGGAMGAAWSAIVLRAELDVPVVVLLDHDDAGRRARDTLVSRFSFVRAKHIVTYADVIEGGPPGVEAETLFDADLMRRFVRQHSSRMSRGERTYGQAIHVELTATGKSAFVSWLRDHARPEHLTLWNDLLDLVEQRLSPVDVS